MSNFEPKKSKHLLFEPLETRALLAADCMPICVEPPETVTPQGSQAEVAEALLQGGPGLEAAGSRVDRGDDLGFQQQDVQAANSVNSSNSDAGSTRATAFDLGLLGSEATSDVSPQTLSGSLSFFDRMDVFRFEVNAETNLGLELNGLSGNADLILADTNGRGIATSRQAGSNSESIETELAPGVYYVGVQARGFWGTRYELEVTAERVAPLPTVETPSDTTEGGSAPDTGGAETGGDTTAFPDVPDFGGRQDWNVNAVNAPEAWAAGFTGQGVTVAVVDTGVDLDHPDLVNNLFVNPGEIPGNGIDDDQNGFIDDVSGYDFVGNDANPDDRNGHGTHVAGTIASLNNGVGSTGIAPDAKILPIKVLGDNGSGSNFSVAAGIRYAADLGAQVINLSLGGGYSRAVQSAVSYANSLGSIVIAAAGNEGAAVPSFPAQLGAALSNVVSVGAHNSGGRSAGFSNRVGASNTVQVDAPGVGVYSTYVGGGYGGLSGTSMASPHVAGVAALALSANPNLTPSELRGLLADGVTTNATGSDSLGIVNAATTVAYAAAGLTTAPNEGASNAASFGRNTSFTRAISLPTAAFDVAIPQTSTQRIVESDQSQESRVELIDTLSSFISAPSSRQNTNPVSSLDFPGLDSIYAALGQQDLEEVLEPESGSDPVGSVLI